MLNNRVVDKRRRDRMKHTAHLVVGIQSCHGELMRDCRRAGSLSRFLSSSFQHYPKLALAQVVRSQPYKPCARAIGCHPSGSMEYTACGIDVMVFYTGCF